MKKLLQYLMGQAKKYSVWDYAFLKFALLALGILLGSYLPSFFQHSAVLPIVWIVFLFSYIWIIVVTIKKK